MRNSITANRSAVIAQARTYLASAKVFYAGAVKFAEKKEPAGTIEIFKLDKEAIPIE